MQRFYRETLASLANALEEKDSYTHDHTQEVVALALDVARELGHGPETLELVELGALFHDIGKIRVPESILNKKGPLDDEEWGIMRSHTIAGEAILAPITPLRDVLPLVRSSHERWDGGGYPDGLIGEEIPAGARIISVCDAFRAMTEQRPYRKAMSERDALLELRLELGHPVRPGLRPRADQRPARAPELTSPSGCTGLRRPPSSLVFEAFVFGGIAEVQRDGAAVVAREDHVAVLVLDADAPITGPPLHSLFRSKSVLLKTDATDANAMTTSST